MFWPVPIANGDMADDMQFLTCDIKRKRPVKRCEGKTKSIASEVFVNHSSASRQRVGDGTSLCQKKKKTSNMSFCKHFEHGV